MDAPQIFLIIDFVIMILLWFTRQGVEEIGFHGWGEIFDNRVSDATISIFGVSLLYLIPVKNGRMTFLLIIYWSRKMG